MIFTAGQTSRNLRSFPLWNRKRYLEAGMRFLRLLAIMALALGLTACSHSKFRSYNGPEVTLIQVDKSDRKMYLFHDHDLLKTYDIALGFAPRGTRNSKATARRPKVSIPSATRTRTRTSTCRCGFPIRMTPTAPMPKRQARNPAGISSFTVDRSNRFPGATGPGDASRCPTARSNRSMR